MKRPASKDEKSTKSSDSEAPKNKKRALKLERQSQKRGLDTFTILNKAKQTWNQLRLKSNAPETITELTNTLWDLIMVENKEELDVCAVAMQHDTSRIIQSLLQFGNEVQRLELVEQLCGSKTSNTKTSSKSTKDTNEKDKVSLPTMAKIQYAHFVVLKVLKYACVKSKSNSAKSAKLNRMRVIKSFRGHLTKLAVHSVGSRCLELLLDTLSASEAKGLWSELYGSAFVLFADTDITPGTNGNANRGRKTLLDVEEGSKARQSALNHVETILVKAFEKQMHSFAYIQTLLADYLDACTPTQRRAFLTANPTLGDNALQLIATRSGSRAVAYLAAYGTAKDRKKMLKSFKGYSVSSLEHVHAYLAVLRLVDCTDDTVTVGKMLFQEILMAPPVAKDDEDDDMEVDDVSQPQKLLLKMALHERASKLLLLLLTNGASAPSNDGNNTKSTTTKSFLDPYERSVLTPSPPTIPDPTDPTLLVPTCKKLPALKYQELNHGFLPPLLELTQRPSHLRQLLTQRVGSRVLMELLMYHTTRVADSDGEAATQICQAVVTTMDSEEGESLWEHPVAHVLVKNWLKTESEHDCASPMATALYQAYKGKLVSQMAQTNRGAFCLLALASTTDAKLKKSIAAELKKGRKELSKKCDGTHTKGYEALLEAIPK